MLKKIKGYWDFFRNHFSVASNRKTLSIITLVAIAITLPAVVILAQNQQTYRQRASELVSPPSPPFPPTGTPTPIGKTSPCGNFGDINLDGVVTTTDAQLIQNYLVKNITLTDQQKASSDVNADGKITIVDALFIGQYVAGTRTAFPVCTTSKATINGRFVDQNNNLFTIPGQKISIKSENPNSNLVSADVSAKWTLDFFAPPAPAYDFLHVTVDTMPGYTITNSACNNCVVDLYQYFANGNTFNTPIKAGDILDVVFKYTPASSTSDAAASTILSCVSYGDIDIDGKITMIDTNFVLKYLAGNTTLTDEQKKRADVNGDGKITVVDALFIGQHVAGSRKTFPVPGCK